MALKWEDIDIEGKTVHVRHGAHFEANKAVVGAPKTDTSVRSIPIFPPLLEALRSLQGHAHSGYVCTSADGKQITQTGWVRAWESYLNAMTNCIHGEQAVRPGRRSDLLGPRQEFSVRPHDLRHTFASMLYDSGVDPKTAQRLLGHASIETTLKIYVHLRSMREQNTELASAFKVLDKGSVPRGAGAILCLREEISAIDRNTFILPIWMI